MKRCANVLRKLAAAQEDYVSAIMKNCAIDAAKSYQEAQHADATAAADDTNDMIGVDSMQSTRDAQMELFAVIKSLGQLQLQYAQRLMSSVVSSLTETHLHTIQRRTE
jgi:hypothetical protein